MHAPYKAGFCQRKPSVPIEEPTGSEIRVKFFKSAESQSPSKNCRAAAVGKTATRRLNQSNNFGVSRKRFKAVDAGVYA